MNRLETLISILVTPFNRFEAAAQDCLTKRWISTGQGAQLDVIGRIVGQDRGGVDDTTYQAYLSAKIYANRATGKHEELIHLCRLVVASATQVVVHREGTATVTVFVDGAVTDAVADVLITFLEEAAALGVRIILRYSNEIHANTFRFDAGPGWDVGHLATALE